MEQDIGLRRMRSRGILPGPVLSKPGLHATYRPWMAFSGLERSYLTGTQSTSAPF